MSLLPSPICLNRERRLLASKLMLLLRPPLCVGSEVTLLSFFLSSDELYLSHTQLYRV